MAAETDARCQGNSSPDTKEGSEIINRKGSASSGYIPLVFNGIYDLGGPVARGGASVDKGKCVPCNACSNSHPPYSYCPYTPCRMCGTVHDYDPCPYSRHFPRGATLPDGYKIICHCGNVFNEEKWACTSCGGNTPVLYAKYCSICNVYYQHNVYECTVDMELAAKFKSIRDKKLSRVPIPYRPV